MISVQFHPRGRGRQCDGVSGSGTLRIVTQRLCLSAAIDIDVTYLFGDLLSGLFVAESSYVV